jgi:hypothetical protein
VDTLIRIEDVPQQMVRLACSASDFPALPCWASDAGAGVFVSHSSAQNAEEWATLSMRETWCTRLVVIDSDGILTFAEFAGPWCEG